MSILDAMDSAPTTQEVSALTDKEKMRIEFDFFYETKGPHYFNLDDGTGITFCTNHGKGEWMLLVNHEPILSSDDSEKIILKALEYTGS